MENKKVILELEISGLDEMLFGEKVPALAEIIEKHFPKLFIEKKESAQVEKDINSEIKKIIDSGSDAVREPLAESKLRIERKLNRMKQAQESSIPNPKRERHSKSPNKRKEKEVASNITLKLLRYNITPLVNRPGYQYYFEKENLPKGVICIPYESKKLKVDVKHIICFCTNGNHSDVFLTEKQRMVNKDAVKTSGNLTEWESLFKEHKYFQFLRIHRSSIVNMENQVGHGGNHIHLVKEIKITEFEKTDKLPVGKSYKEIVEKYFESFPTLK